LVINTLASVGLRQKSSSLHMFLHGIIYADDGTRELFKPLKDSESLHVCNETKILVLGLL